jgi:hypothetical protein
MSRRTSSAKLRWLQRTTSKRDSADWSPAETTPDEVAARPLTLATDCILDRKESAMADLFGAC